MDCSPLLLVESLIRECPVLVNEDILGGWKYVDQDTGSFFNLNNLDKNLDFMLSKKNFNSRDSYMAKYGYLKTSIRLARFIGKYFRDYHGMKMVGLHGTKRCLRKFWKKR